MVLPGLDIDLNINGKIIALNNEIMIRIETPEEFQLGPGYSYSPAAEGELKRGDSGRFAATQPTPPPQQQPCAIKLRAELSFTDLIDDSKDIDGYIKDTLDINQMSTVGGSGAGGQKSEKAQVVDSATKNS